MANEHKAYGYSVATGQRLWKVDTHDQECSFTATGHRKTTYLLITGSLPRCRNRLLRFDGGKQRYDTTLKPPAKLTSGSKRDSSAGSGATPGIQAIDSNDVSVQLSWRGLSHRREKHIERTQLIDESGTLRGARDRPLYSHPWSLPLPIKDTRSKNTSRWGMLVENSNHRLDWQLVDQKLRRKSAAALHQKPLIQVSNYEPTVRRMGHYLGLLRHGKAQIRRIDKELTRLETIDSTKLSKCSSKGTGLFSGDGRQLVLGCKKHTVYVRPIA